MITIQWVHGVRWPTDSGERRGFQGSDRGPLRVWGTLGWMEEGRMYGPHTPLQGVSFTGKDRLSSEGEKLVCIPPAD